MGNVSKLIFGAAIAVVSIASPAQFLLIRMDMSQEVAKDEAFTISSRC
jgi:hypothetical protein